MTMGQRPAHLKAPAHLSKSPPLPQPGEAGPSRGPTASTDKDGRLDPTRYGDWERNGIAVDF
jgi:hypothetical protein